MHVPARRQPPESYYGGTGTTCGSSRSCSMTGSAGQQNCWKLTSPTRFWPTSARSTRTQSWLAALTAILDTCALIMAGINDGPTRQAQLTFAMARHAVADLAQIFARSRQPVFAPDRLPPSSLTALRDMLANAGITVQDGAADQKLHDLRQMYEHTSKA